MDWPFATGPIVVDEVVSIDVEVVVDVVDTKHQSPLCSLATVKNSLPFQCSQENVTNCYSCTS